MREWLACHGKHSSTVFQRKFFYLSLTWRPFFSPSWRGCMIAWFSLVWVANAYMSLFGRLRLDIKHEHIEIAASGMDLQLKEPLSIAAKIQ